MYKCKHCGKEFDDKRKLAGHSTHCKLNPKYEHNMECLANARTHIKQHNHSVVEEVLHCKYCGKECYGKKSLKVHERLCSQNPNKEKSNLKGFVEYGHTAWNKGLSKESDERVMKQSKTLTEHYHNGDVIVWSKGLTKESDERVRNMSEKISEGMDKKINETGWTPMYKSKRVILYNGVYLHGTWEVIFAEYLDEHNIRWERISRGFKYFFGGTHHFYYPDFYLPDVDLYIGIKGFPEEKDYAKWDTLINVHKKKLNVYLYKDLLEIGLKPNGYSKFDIPERFKFKHSLF